jgi:hypothetical protein
VNESLQPISERPQSTVFLLPGMTLRDYFAGQALVGFITSQAYADRDFASLAYDIANEMLVERERPR